MLCLLLLMSAPNVSLDLHQADVRRVVQSLAAHGVVNVVIDDAVGGTVTVSVRDVRWRDALAAVLSAKGLDSREEGNILWIASAAKIAADRERALQQQKTIVVLPK